MHAGWASGLAEERAGEQAGRQSERAGARMSERRARGRAGRVNSTMKKLNHNRIAFDIDDGMIANQRIETKKRKETVVASYHLT